MAELIGTVKNGNCKTGAEMAKTFTASQSYTIPTGYTKMDLFVVGGGGGGGYGSTSGSERVKGAGGGGGGYTKTVKNIAIGGGQALSIVVGGGGKGGSNKTNGNQSSVARNGSVLINADGGRSCGSLDSWGFDGGSGGGSGAYISGSGWDNDYGGKGGSNGSKGFDANGKNNGAVGDGQGTTTRAWGAANGTLYAGGGGGGARMAYVDDNGVAHGAGAGGAGGGGAGGVGKSNGAANGATNTGGGGGGDAWNKYGTTGGSGIVLLKLY